MDYLITVYANCLVDWEQDGESFSENPHLSSAFEHMGLSVTPSKLHALFYENPRGGTGDFHIYQSTSSQATLGVDFYRWLTDQSDAITLIVRSMKNDAEVSAKLSKFIESLGEFKQESAFIQSSYNDDVQKWLRQDSYPKLIKDDYGHIYKQRLYVFD